MALRTSRAVETDHNLTDITKGPYDSCHSISWFSVVYPPPLSPFPMMTAPTILEAIGVGPPTIINGVAQRPYDGVPLGYTFFNATAPSTRQTQYFEMWGESSLDDD